MNTDTPRKTPIQLDTVLPELMLQFAPEALTTATNVFESATRTQGNVHTIHGPASEHELKEMFPNTRDISPVEGDDLYTEPGQVVHIHPATRSNSVRSTANFLNSANHNTSIVLSGLKDNTIIIHSKLNHVLIRRSENIDLDIKEGTVSGVDILHCRRMLVKMPYHNFTNLEFGEGINFQAEVNDVSQLHITGSLDIKVNNTTIPINPFVNAIFTKNGWCYMKQHEIPKLMICKY